MNILEAQEKATELRTRGNTSNYVGKDDLDKMLADVDIDSDEMVEAATVMGDLFAEYARQDKPPLAQLIAGMWADGFLSGVLYEKGK